MLRLQTDAGRPAAFSQLFALGRPLDGALSNQREDRAEGGSWNVTCTITSAWAMRSTSARRAEASYLQSGEGPVVLLSAGIGATPVLAMLYALASAHSTRQVLWLHAARDGQHHPFAAEVRRLMRSLTRGRSFVCYSKPAARDKMGEDFDATGHLSRSVFDAVGVSREADVYLCGPTRFMADMKEALATLGVAAGANSRRAVQRQRVDHARCGRSDDTSAASPQGRRRDRSAGVVRAQRHRRSLEGVQPTRAFWSSLRRATSRSVGRAGPVCVTPARVGWCRGMSPTDRSRSKSRPTATCWCVAHNPRATS